MNQIENASSLLRFVPLSAFILICVLFLCFCTDQLSVTGRPSVDMLLVVAVLNFGVYLFVRVWSKLPLYNQLFLIVPIVLLQILGLVLLKFDGLYGNGRPVLVWRYGKANLIEEAMLEDSAIIATETNPIVLPELGNADWPSFRGVRRDGVVAGELADWNRSPPREIWRISIGEGWSSFATCGDYCFTQEQRGEFEAAVCREISSGRECWVHLDKSRFEEVSGGNGPRATPTISSGKLYSLGATGILNCIEATKGELLWTVNVLADNKAENLLFGVGSSPLVNNGLVYACAGGRDGSLVAYQCDTGEKVWAVGAARASYGSPHFARICGREQILIYNAEGLDSHDPKTGEILWRIPWTNQSPDGTNVCQPILLEGDRVLISSGYEGGCAVHQLKYEDKVFRASPVWENKNLESKFASAVQLGEFVYGLDNGVLVCVNVLDGKRAWKQGRYGHGQLLLVGSQLLIQAEKGFVAIVEATPTAFHEIARHGVFERRTWTHPVLAGKYLLVRNDREAVCLELKLD